MYNLINAFVYRCFAKRTIYNIETKREAENERRENERSQSGHKKALTADSAPDPNYLYGFSILAVSVLKMHTIV